VIKKQPKNKQILWRLFGPSSLNDAAHEKNNAQTFLSIGGFETVEPITTFFVNGKAIHPPEN
jgi:hypothetical protein